MTEISDRYRRLSTAFTEKVAATPDGRWESPSPCKEWTARDVLRHIVDTHGNFLGMVGRSMGDIPSVDDEPLAAWIAARDTVQADLDDPARASAEYDGRFGRSTFERAVDGFLCFDQVIHGWDLARATGQDERIDPAEVQRIGSDISGFGDMLTKSGACGPPIEPPPGADDQTRLLMALGRRP
jgi:uncharacterized protein (TIGR03086 family)